MFFGHHSEDLETMLLVPHRIHAGVDHWGSVAIIRRMVSSSEQKMKHLWRRILGFEN